MSILNIELERDDQGVITADTLPYDPPQKVRDVTVKVITDFDHANNIMSKPYREFDDMSLIQRMNDDQKVWNTFRGAGSDDIDEAWKSRAIRPIVRNRLISIAANLTGNLIFPKQFAQNENDEEDRAASRVMQSLNEWRANEAGYERNFLYAVISALVNPAVIYYTEFAEAFRTVKEKDPVSGAITERTILDDAYSGFQDTIVPLDEFFIENIYEHDIQKQNFVIWRKFISFETAETKYGHNSLFKQFVRPGIQTIFDEESGVFYQQKDPDLKDRLVEEVIAFHRKDGTRRVFTNGLMITDPDEPNPRQDFKFPFAKSGYELFDEGKFFYFRSAVQKMAIDEEVVNTLYRMLIDGTYLQIMPPTAVFGDEIIDSSVVKPGQVNSFAEGTKLETITTNNNLTAAMNTLNIVEASVNESSASPRSAGISESGQQTATEVARLERNAQINLGLFGKMIGFLVKDLGDLFNSDIIQYLTVGEVTEIAGAGGKLKFRKFLLPDTVNAGRKKTTKIMFDGEMKDITTEEQQLNDSFDILEQEGDLDADSEIMVVNPTLFRNLKFKSIVSPDVVTPPSDNLKKVLNLEQYDRAVQNPLADQEAVYRRLLLGSYDTTRDNPDEFVAEQQLGEVLGQPTSTSPVNAVQKAELGEVQ